MIRLFLSNSITVLLFLPFIVGIYFILNFQNGYYAQVSNLDFGLWSNLFNGNGWIYQLFDRGGAHSTSTAGFLF